MVQNMAGARRWKLKAVSAVTTTRSDTGGCRIRADLGTCGTSQHVKQRAQSIRTEKHPHRATQVWKGIRGRRMIASGPVRMVVRTVCSRAP